MTTVSQKIFTEFGGEPIALKRGYWGLKISGVTPANDCRVVAEEVYQALVYAADHPEPPHDK
jgi:hypothetical protein